MKWTTFILLFFLVGSLNAQSAHRQLRKGDRQYKENDLGGAEDAYRRALESENSAQGSYNLGNTIYQQGRYGEAVKHYEKAAEESRVPEAKANAFHNLGNAYFQQQEYEKSVEAYKNALRLNPGDMETKINLAQAMRFLPPPAPQEQPQPEDGEGEEQEQDQQQDQNQQNDQSSGEQPQEEQQPSDDNNQDQQNQSSAGQPSDDEREISQEEAERLLDIMANEEQKTMEKLRQAQSKACGSSKDW
jgi:tetratricopeptide (TPR) repeat protein